MTLRVVIDTNLWIRALLGGQVTLPILEAWRTSQFIVVVGQPLIDELNDVWQHPRLRDRINPEGAERLLEQLHLRGEMVVLATVPLVAATQGITRYWPQR